MIPNLFVFHGIDHKVGTTMITQSVAELLSNNDTNLKILLISMNGRESAEYVRESTTSIDSMKYHIDNKMISGSDFLKTCNHKGNLYYMSGILNELEARHYNPEMSKYLLEEISPEFDMVISDSGNELDNGLTIGALSLGTEVFLILTQNESAIKRYEKNKDLINQLGVAISGYLVNKYEDHDPYGISYLCGRAEIEKDKISKISMSSCGRQAEMEYKTLLEYKNQAYEQDIIKIANYILNKCGYEEITKKRKSKWKSFI